MDVYFVLIDYLMRMDVLENPAEDDRSILWGKISENITGSDQWNRLYTSLHVYRVRKDLFIGTYLDYIESTKLLKKLSDLGADVRTK